MLLTQKKPISLLNSDNKIQLIYLEHKMHIVADTYVVLNEISRCRMGSVHLATHVKNRSVVAIKFVPTNVVQCFNNENVLQRIFCSRKRDQIDMTVGKLPAEFVFGTVCQSPEIIRYDACFIDQGCWAMVMEFPEGYSVLRDYVISHGPLDLSSLYKIAKQLAAALNTCVVNGVDHRDLSQDNILYNPETKRIKLVGLGHATSLSYSKEPYKAPKDCNNLPPEATKYGVCSPLQTLVWKFGSILHYCMVGAGRLSRLSGGSGTGGRSPSSLSSSNNPIEFIIRRCLDQDPRTRILFSNLQKHIHQHM
ncbi:hypothetical protein ACHWQZ_G013222 [Mnemiopsis leidyi]